VIEDYGAINLDMYFMAEAFIWNGMHMTGGMEGV